MKNRKILLSGMISALFMMSFDFTFAAPNPASVITFTNPLAFDTVQGLLGSLLGSLQGIIVTLSIVFIVIGAILYITSAGKEQQTTLAKGAITAAVVGLAIGIAAPSFLKEIYSIVGGSCAGLSGQALADCQAAAAALDAAQSISSIVMNTLNFLLSLVGILGIIMLVAGGMMYMTAAGDENRIDKAKTIIFSAIIGIIIALTALVVVRQVASLF